MGCRSHVKLTLYKCALRDSIDGTPFGVCFSFKSLNPWYNTKYMQIRKTVDFPFIEQYREKFSITDKTIFACYPDIYCNYPMRPDILLHEMVHLRQQERDGLTNWVYDFLEYPEKRLEYEVEAYREQIKSIKDRNQKVKILYECAKNLSSPLYGDIITFDNALTILK